MLPCNFCHHYHNAHLNPCRVCGCDPHDLYGSAKERRRQQRSQHAKPYLFGIIKINPYKPKSSCRNCTKPITSPSYPSFIRDSFSVFAEHEFPTLVCFECVDSHRTCFSKLHDWGWRNRGGGWLTGLSRWRDRRKTVKELRGIEGELKKEHESLREGERKMYEGPPGYDELERERRREWTREMLECRENTSGVNTEQSLLVDQDPARRSSEGVRSSSDR